MFERWVLICVFLLPWQTRYIFEQKLLNGVVWEYGILSVYAVELLVLFTFFFGQRLRLPQIQNHLVRRLGIVLVVTLLSAFIAFDPELSFFQWLHLAVAGLLFLLLLDQRVNPFRALVAFVAGLGVPIFLGVWQVFTGTSPASSWLGLAPHASAQAGASVIEGVSSRWLRAYGTFSHPNVFGGYLAMGLFATLALLLKNDRLYRWPLLLALPIFSFVLTATFSRSGWLAFLTALFVSGSLMLWKHRLRAQSAIPLLSFVMLTLALSVGLLSDPVFARFSPALRLEARSLTERQSEYQIFPEVFATSPLFGTGIGGYTIALAKQNPNATIWSYQPIHNSLLLGLAEVGLVGALTIVAWVAAVDRLNYAAIARGSTAAITAIGFGTILLVVAIFDHYLWSSWSGLALTAFAMAMTIRLSEY